MKKWKLAVVLLGCIFVLAGCSGQGSVPGEDPDAASVEDPDAYPDPNVSANGVEESGLVAANGHTSSYGMPRERKDGKVRSYLTGKWVDESIGDRRPVAVMLNNIEEAQPMSGVSAADIIYECVVERSITRLMGIFEDYDKQDKIGSVRSCRNYFVYYALELDAIYAHYGQSAYAVSLLEQDFVDNLSGLAGVGGIVYYRTSDRVAPHNAYASGKGINEGIRRMKYRTEYRDDYKGKFTFADDDETIVPDVDAFDAKVIKPGYFINEPWFEYKEEDGKYYRYQYGEPQIDDVNDEQLAVDNLILQYSSWEEVDDKGYLGFDCHAGGDMIYITKGKAEKGYWIRYDGDQGSVRYYDTEGHEIVVNQGKTWICIIQDTYGDKVEIS